LESDSLRGEELREAARELAERAIQLDTTRETRRLQTIGPLAAGIAHDFNNLLMGIRGVVELASRKLPEGHSVRSHLDEIRGVATSGASITQQLRSLASSGDLRRSAVDVDARIAGMRGLLRTLLGEDVKLELRLNAPDCRIEADAIEFEHTLLHLAVQSRNAMPAGGRLRISTRTFDELPPEVPGDFGDDPVLRLRVQDTGDTDPDASDDAFAAVIEFAEALDGTCSNTRIEDTTVIDLWLPCTEVDLRDELDETDDESSLAPATILVVEDDRLVRRTLRQYLESANHQVLEAATAAEAESLAAELSDDLDLLVTDSVLEDGYGLDVAANVMASVPSVGILFVSAHGFGQLVQDRRVPERARFLQKPFERDELLDDVDDAIRAARRKAT
jgi:CheY-like chemotaxis protein